MYLPGVSWLQEHAAIWQLKEFKSHLFEEQMISVGASSLFM
jgi:hypothetical protein